MEEGQAVEIQEMREPLREQGSIRALLELLEQQGMEQEKRDVIRMADYIDSMIEHTAYPMATKVIWQASWIPKRNIAPQ